LEGILAIGDEIKACSRHIRPIEKKPSENNIVQFNSLESKDALPF